MQGRRRAKFNKHAQAIYRLWYISQFQFSFFDVYRYEEREMVQRLTGKKSRRWGGKSDLESKKTGMGREEDNGLPLRNKGMLDAWKGGRDDARVSVYFNLNVFELFVGSRSRYSKCTITLYRTIRYEQMSLPIFGRGKKQRILGRSPIRSSMTDKGLHVWIHCGEHRRRNYCSKNKENFVLALYAEWCKSWDRCDTHRLLL